MLSEELLQKVRQIEISSRRWVDDVLAGSFKSQFKGQGVQFSEHREYIPGDDVRHIDWKVSARARDFVIRKYEEERERIVMLALDLSGSEYFGSQGKSKNEVAAELAALIAMAANRTGDRVGAIFFAGEVEKVIPPAKGRSHILRLVESVLSFEPRTKGTDLAAALKSVDRVMKHRGMVFVVSDLLAENFGLELKRLGRKHDLTLLQVRDRREKDLELASAVWAEDPETGEEFLFDPRSPRFKKWWKQWSEQQERQIKELAGQGHVDRLIVSGNEDYAGALVSFFRKRALRRR